MRSPRLRAAFFAGLALAGCSNPLPPAGRWEGVYEDSALIVTVRLEIGASGDVRVSAPNAITKDESLSDADRAEIKARLLEGLAKSWPAVGNMALEFDGKAFHKPGGAAPQLEWDAKAQRMTMIYYQGRTASVRVPLSPVDAFKDS
jgi:hypothetical protein